MGRKYATDPCSPAGSRRDRHGSAGLLLANERLDASVRRQHALEHRLRTQAPYSSPGTRVRRSASPMPVALQALYRYFYNLAFHGIDPQPVTRFNFDHAIDEAFRGGEALARVIRSGLAFYASLHEAICR